MTEGMWEHEEWIKPIEMVNIWINIIENSFPFRFIRMPLVIESKKKKTFSDGVFNVWCMRHIYIAWREEYHDLEGGKFSAFHLQWQNIDSR